MTLRAHMVASLAGWPAGAPAAWQATFEDTALNFRSRSLGAIHDGAARPAYPRLLAGDDGRHLFRAFRGIAPDRVRVVVIGQDPYPDRVRATGRAFEDGAAHVVGMAESLKRLLQSAFTAMDLEPQADQNPAGWTLIQARVEAHLPDQAAMERYFDGLAGQGVLFLNAAWTFTEVEPHPASAERRRRLARAQRAHRALWRPVMLRLIEALRASDPPPVFLLLGAHAQGLLNEGDPVRHSHPTPRNPALYFNGENPLRRVNQALAALGRDEILWWPPQEPAGA